MTQKDARTLEALEGLWGSLNSLCQVVSAAVRQEPELSQTMAQLGPAMKHVRSTIDSVRAEMSSER